MSGYGSTQRVHLWCESGYNSTACGVGVHDDMKVVHFYAVRNGTRITCVNCIRTNYFNRRVSDSVGLATALKMGEAKLMADIESKDIPEDTRHPDNRTRRLYIGQRIMFDYINHRLENSRRGVIVIDFRFGTTPHHPQPPQMFIQAFDLSKREERTFAMKDMSNITFDD